MLDGFKTEVQVPDHGVLTSRFDFAAGLILLPIDLKSDLNIMSLRLQLAELLRQVHLLQLADYVLFHLNVLRYRGSNARFIREHSCFVPPPLHLAYDAYNDTDLQVYFERGKKHAGLIAVLVKEYLPSGEIRICEWGCGPASVIQHLRESPNHTKAHLLGTDYNEETITWGQRNFQDIDFIANRLEPPLSIESSSQDCVYAISVFTHLSEEMHYLLLDELFRVLKPGGLLLFTTHGDLCANRLVGSERAQCDAGEMVVLGQIKEGRKHFSAHHPPRFVENELLKGRNILKHLVSPQQYGLAQDMWAIRKPDSN